MSNTTNFKVDFIGVGAPKCGTTWIAECLAEHPDVCFSWNKEPHFFNRDREYEKGLDYYRTYFKNCENHAYRQAGHAYRQAGKKLRGEYTVNYLYFDSAAERIKKDFPDAKIIIALRNPIDRAYSNFRYEQSRVQIPDNISFENAVRQKEYARFINYSLYSDGLKRYLARFPKENVLIVIYEDIKKDPLAFIQNIYRFVGADPSYAPKNLNETVNFATSKGFRIPTVERFSRQVFNFFFPQKRGERFSWLRKILKFIGLNKIFFWLKKSNRGGGLKKPEPLSQETRIYLHEIVKNDVAEVEKIINRKLDFWK